MNRKTERDGEILMMYANGKSYSTISKKYNLTKERVKQIIRTQKAKEKQAVFISNENVSSFFNNVEDICIEQGLHKKIFTNIYNSLSESGIVLAMMHGDDLDNWTDEQLLRLKGFGEMSLQIVREAYSRSKE